MSTISKKSNILLAIGAVVVIVAAAALSDFIQKGSGCSINTCASNLCQLDGAKQRWAAENNEPTNAVPTWEDVRPYLRHELVCPQRGTYILGTVDELPKCSVGGRHALSK